MLDLDRLFPPAPLLPSNDRQPRETEVSQQSRPVPDTLGGTKYDFPSHNHDITSPVPAVPGCPGKKEEGGRKTHETATRDDKSEAPEMGSPAGSLRAETAGSGFSCAGCEHLNMRSVIVPESRRRYWWCCSKGHAMLEVWGGPRHELIAPPSCGDFKQWVMRR